MAGAGLVVNLWRGCVIGAWAARRRRGVAAGLSVGARSGADHGFAGGGAGVHVAVVHAGDGADDGQAQAVAFGARGTALARAEETVEDAGQVGGGDGGAGVAHFHARAAGDGSQRSRISWPAGWP